MLPLEENFLRRFPSRKTVTICIIAMGIEGCTITMAGRRRKRPAWSNVSLLFCVKYVHA